MVYIRKYSDYLEQFKKALWTLKCEQKYIFIFCRSIVRLISKIHNQNLIKMLLKCLFSLKSDLGIQYNYTRVVSHAKSMLFSAENKK